MRRPRLGAADSSLGCSRSSSAPRVFLWRQPFRWRSEPDHLPGDGARPARRPPRPWLLLQPRPVESVAASAARRRTFPSSRSASSRSSVRSTTTAQTIAAAMTRLEQATGLAPVIVAHSMGGLAARAWLAAQPEARAAIASSRSLRRTPARDSARTVAARTSPDAPRQRLARAAGRAGERGRRARASPASGAIATTSSSRLATRRLPAPTTAISPVTPHVQMVDHPAVFEEVLRTDRCGASAMTDPSAHRRSAREASTALDSAAAARPSRRRSPSRGASAAAGDRLRKRGHLGDIVGDGRVVPARGGVPRQPRRRARRRAHRSGRPAAPAPVSAQQRGQPPRGDQRLLELVELDAQDAFVGRRSSAASDRRPASRGCAAPAAARGTRAASRRIRAARRRRGRWPRADRCDASRRRARSARRDALAAGRAAGRPAPRANAASRSSTAVGAAKARKNGGMPIMTSAAMTVSGAGDDAAAAMIRDVGEHLQRHERIAADHLADAVGVGALLVRAQGVERLDGFAQHRDLGAAEMARPGGEVGERSDQLSRRGSSSSSSRLRTVGRDTAYRHRPARRSRARTARTSAITAPAPGLRRRRRVRRGAPIGRLHRVATARGDDPQPGRSRRRHAR